MDQRDQLVLESMVDRFSVADVLEALGCICGEKSDHLLSAWQDKESAKEWNRAASQCYKAAQKIEV